MFKVLSLLLDFSQLSQKILNYLFSNFNDKKARLGQNILQFLADSATSVVWGNFENDISNIKFKIPGKLNFFIS